MSNFLHHPMIVFALTFICTWLVYMMGKAMAAAGSPSAGKGKVYACGEDVGADIRPSYGWFHIAFVFTLLDIGVLMIATMPTDVHLPLALGWLVGAAGAIFMLFKDKD